MNPTPKIIVALLALALLAAAPGCALFNKNSDLTPEQKVNSLKHDYEMALPVVTALFGLGIIPGKMADSVVFARKEARSFIEDALVRAKSGALDWEFYYEQAVAALGRYLQFKADGEAEAKRQGLDPKHLPATRPARPVAFNPEIPCGKPFSLLRWA